MNYEEKYNEILEWARKNKARLNGVPIEEVLPELAESEDERIRKFLVDFFASYKIGDVATKLNGVRIDDILAYLEKQKEQKPLETPSPSVIYTEQGDVLAEKKPAESISQLPVQGKGVYKICPRCKERMVRDDSMVYTSMPPQYRYECPKCGEREFDTVMYVNPEMEEQKPNSTEDMPYITDEHFYEREPADSFKYKLAEYMTRCCTKKEGPYGYEYGISAESILKMAEEELLKRGVVQKPAEWSEEDEDFINMLILHFNYLIDKGGDSVETYKSYREKLKFLKPHWKPSEVCYGPTGDPDPAGVWKPSEEQMKALLNAEGFLRAGLQHDSAKTIAELYEQLKKL